MLVKMYEGDSGKHTPAERKYSPDYNFARIRKTLRVTPAMEAGVSDHVWSLEEIAALAE